MRKLCLLLSVLVLAAGCMATKSKEETVAVSPGELQQKQKEYEHLQSQISAKDRQIAELEGTLAQIQKIVEGNGSSGGDTDIETLRKLSEQATEVAERIKKLEQELNATSKKAEQAAARLLLEARCFERDNPTEAKSIIAAKYKTVLERYPQTKAAKEAGKRCKELSE